jgi:hypothetical protein
VQNSTIAPSEGGRRAARFARRQPRSRAADPTDLRIQWLSRIPGLIDKAGAPLQLASEISLPAQTECLRVLQEREFQRLGGTRIQKVNIRVVAATNRDLRKAVERGTFRKDLYYHAFGRLDQNASLSG